MGKCIKNRCEFPLICPVYFCLFVGGNFIAENKCGLTGQEGHLSLFAFGCRITWWSRDGLSPQTRSSEVPEDLIKDPTLAARSCCSCNQLPSHWDTSNESCFTEDWVTISKSSHHKGPSKSRDSTASHPAHQTPMFSCVVKTHFDVFIRRRFS